MIDVTNDKLLTQGTIFNCAYNSSYPDDETLGLIITARCDINKDKVSFYNYIPAIPFNIWKEKELLPVLKKKTYKDLRSKYLTLLREGGFSESNLKTYGYERIIDIIKIKHLCQNANYNLYRPNMKKSNVSKKTTICQTT
uniref:hypothetical protein n=1 Tax=Escherichia coli TaxID=562 RepID=UPI003D3DE148